MKLVSFVEKQRYAINRVLTSGHLSNLFTLCVRQVIFVALHKTRPLADNRVHPCNLWENSISYQQSAIGHQQSIINHQSSSLRP